LLRDREDSCPKARSHPMVQYCSPDRTLRATLNVPITYIPKAIDPTASFSKLSGGAIAGIVVGSFLFSLVLVGIFIYFFLRRNNGKDVSLDRGEVTQVYQKSSPVEPPPVALSANEEIPKNPTNHELRTPDDCKGVLPSGCIEFLDKKQ
jgi:hypothetical protein